MIASRDDCPAVGAWIDDQRVTLIKEAFFVRADVRIMLCRRSSNGEWRTYSGIASTDRFHIVVKSGN